VAKATIAAANAAIAIRLAMPCSRNHAGATGECFSFGFEHFAEGLARVVNEKKAFYSITFWSRGTGVRVKKQLKNALRLVRRRYRKTVAAHRDIRKESAKLPSRSAPKTRLKQSCDQPG
jgi:hypothetical protein